MPKILSQSNKIYIICIQLKQFLTLKMIIILGYLRNLFETNKPYFMNCMRVPAAQTLLLYARSLDTNDHCTRIICDEWIELRFLDAELAQKLLSSVLYLRASIERLFKTRLDDRLSVFKREECELGDLDQEGMSIQLSLLLYPISNRSYHRKRG